MKDGGPAGRRAAAGGAPLFDGEEVVGHGSCRFSPVQLLD
jgi:hypothetical protein